MTKPTRKITWVKPAIPRSVAMAIPVDPEGGVIIQHRSDKVRSAKNVWSFPSGLQETGETLEDCCKRELLEELNLEPVRFKVLGRYDNIAGDTEAVEQYHWAITIVACLVDDVKVASNLEPDKHDQLLCCNYLEMASLRFWMIYHFQRSFDNWARHNCLRMAADIQELIR